MTQTPLVVAKWKAYQSLEGMLDFLTKFSNEKNLTDPYLYLALPHFLLYNAPKMPTGTAQGADDMGSLAEESFTHKVAAKVLKEANVNFVLLGSSDKRHVFGESNASIKEKVGASLAAGFQTVLCIGETADEYKEGKTQEVLTSQLTECLSGVAENKFASVIIAYEVPWSIMTGPQLDLPTYQKMVKLCRELIASNFKGKGSSQMRLLIGLPLNIEEAFPWGDENGASGFYFSEASIHPEFFQRSLQTLQGASKVQATPEEAPPKPARKATKAKVAVEEVAPAEAPPEKKKRAPRKKKIE